MITMAIAWALNLVYKGGIDIETLFDMFLI